MLVLIPLLFFAVTYFQFIGGSSPRRVEWAGSFLRCALLWGAAVILISEVLGIFDQIRTEGVALAWLIALAGAFHRKDWRANTVRGLARIRALALPRVSAPTMLYSAIAASSFLLLIVALASPPNNTDSLQYHMSRVAHWAQNGSLDHYAASYHPQLWSPPWSETAILNLRTLWGNDRLANLIQWFSMVGSMIGVWGLTRQLNGSLRARLLAVAFVFSIPMGILQSTSTQNDYVATLWLVCLAYFVLADAVEPTQGANWLKVSLALGLGILTKGTVYLYGLPLLAWWGINQLRSRNRWHSAARITALVFITLILNLGFWMRNVETYSGPLGPDRWVQQSLWVTANPGDWAASLIKQVALNFPTPSERINEEIAAGIVQVSQWLGDERDPFRFTWSWNHEDLAGNPLHMLLVPGSLILLLFARDRVSGTTWVFAAAVLLSFLLYGSFIYFNMFGVRHQLSFLVLWAPVTGIAIAAVANRKVALGLSALLLLLSLPWVLFNRSRPLIGWYPRTTIESVLVEPQSAVLLANWPEHRDPYVDAASTLRDSRCRAVGLRIDSHDLEYGFWWLLEAPQSGTRIETINPLQSLAHLSDPDFEPCAIICTICGDRRELRGLPLVISHPHVKLYLSPSLR